ncbi:MAG TPA: hypothetical protein DEQ02_01510 [Ruminococcaceae bacterium]|nr:hypothetical protein [Oscillospiraceae bacterium]
MEYLVILYLILMITGYILHTNYIQNESNRPRPKVTVTFVNSHRANRLRGISSVSYYMREFYNCQERYNPKKMKSPQ